MTRCRALIRQMVAIFAIFALVAMVATPSAAWACATAGVANCSSAGPACDDQHGAPDCVINCAALCSAVTAEPNEFVTATLPRAAVVWEDSEFFLATLVGPEPPPPRLG